MAVAETGSFTKAAHLLNISQPAVSQNISALEKETGVQLILRAKGSASLTSYGEVFKTYASRIQYWYSATSEMFGERGRITSGRPVRIAADSVTGSYLLPSALSIISGARPDILFNVRIIQEKREAPSDRQDVPGSHFGTPEDADVEISASPSPDTIDFEGESRLVGVMDAIVVASPKNRSVKSAAVSPEDDELTVKPFSTIAGVPVSNRFAVWSGYAGFFTPDLEARTSLVSDSIEAVKTIVEGSVSLVGIVPALSVCDELASGALVQMPVRLPGFTYDVHFNPLPEFAGKEICRLLKETLTNNLKTR